MVERVHIPLSTDPGIAPGTWAVIDGQPVARCPQCKVASAMANHSVNADGEVNASIACFPPCTYHVWGILDGWNFGVKPAGQPIQSNTK